MSQHHSTHQELQTETIALQVKREPGCSVIFDITIQPKAVEAAYLKALKNINKEISFPGFRKGHAPAAFLEQKFSKEIDQEWRRVVSEVAFSDALKLSKIYPRTEKSVKNVDLKSLSRQEGGQMHVEFECHPDVPGMDLSGFSFEPVERTVISDDDVEKTIHQLRLEKTRLEPVEGRPSQKGDIVMIDMDALVGDKKETVRVVNGRLLEVGSPFNPEWLDKLVTGLSAGESADGEIACDANTHEGHSHGRRVTLLEINTGELAPISEELLKEVGCDSEEMLRSQVRKQLERQEDQRLLDLKAQQLEHFMAERYDFDVPKSMYETSARQLAQKQINALKNTEGWEENFAARSEEIHHSFESELKKALRRFLICDKVAREKGIQVTEQEMYMEHIREVMQEGRSDKLTEDEIPRLYSKLLQYKVINYLTSQVEQRTA